MRFYEISVGETFVSLDTDKTNGRTFRRLPFKHMNFGVGANRCVDIKTEETWIIGDLCQVEPWDYYFGA